MKGLSGVLAIAALIATADLAQGVTAGHLLKSTPPVAEAAPENAGSIKKKPELIDPDITGSIPKRAAKHSGVKGAAKPKTVGQ